ncbi:MAG: hypothetical protein J0L77_05210 [Alphaproteobacteria bacterium]|nr:hypothetical protein [Alphaproteobacteria bacterium]
MKNILLILLMWGVGFPALAADDPEGASAPVAVSAADPGEDKAGSGLPIPRFVSLRSDKVFVRTGPALRYPIKWVYNRADMPVEIIQEFDTWRKIKDIDGDEGWVHQSLLSPKRAVLVTAPNDINLNKEPDLTTPVLAKLEPHVLAMVKACDPVWCEVEAGGYQGWTERKYLWGVYPQERFN